jgi:triosephosphate isomerase
MTVGVSLKMYFGHREALAWIDEVAARVPAHPAVSGGRVEVFVVPGYLQVLPAVVALAGGPVRVGVQDVAAAASGPHTGEVAARELAEAGVTLAEIGHAERRRLYGDTDEVVASKTALALAAGVTPLLCIGEPVDVGPEAAVVESVAQLRSALAEAPAGPVIVAYEPVWAIGAAKPAPAAHIATVSRGLHEALDALPERAGSIVIYGGSAGPGLLAQLGRSVDGLFLGRLAHDVDKLMTVIDEAAALAR